MEVVASRWQRKLDKLQVRLVLRGGEPAAKAEPEQGTGLRVGEGLGAGMVPGEPVDPGEMDTLHL